jgi:hypothetical protein
MYINLFPDLPCPSHLLSSVPKLRSINSHGLSSSKILNEEVSCRSVLCSFYLYIIADTRATKFRKLRKPISWESSQNEHPQTSRFRSAAEFASASHRIHINLPCCVSDFIITPPLYIPKLTGHNIMSVPLLQNSLPFTPMWSFGALFVLLSTLSQN